MTTPLPTLQTAISIGGLPFTTERPLADIPLWTEDRPITPALADIFLTWLLRRTYNEAPNRYTPVLYTFLQLLNQGVSRDGDWPTRYMAIVYYRGNTIYLPHCYLSLIHI